MSARNRNGAMSRRDFILATSAALTACQRTYGATDAGRRRAEPEYDCDVCIIGSGFAGTYLGLRLVSQGVRVLIVEAGPRLSLTDSADGRTSLFPWATAGSLAFPFDETRTIGVGGTSRKWNGVITRLLPSDFRTHSERGVDVDWPLTYDELAAYYCQAESALAVQGTRHVNGAEPARCVYPVESSDHVSPAPLFAPRTLAFFPLAFALQTDGPLRLAEKPLDRFVASPYATLIHSHPVTALNTDRTGAVVSVDARGPDGSVRAIRARFVVVAAGVLETARLLLTSPTNAATNGRGLGGALVGAHFNAHPRYRTAVAPRNDLRRHEGVHRTYEWNRTARGEGAFHADIHLMPRQPHVDMMLELEATASNRIRLNARRRDQWGRPTVELRADWTGRDRRTLARSLAIGRELAACLGTATSPTPALRWFHPAGVCRMANSDRHGVVDATCRVFGTSNLYVAGASVFPTAGSTNPTLTVVALSLRLGDRLARLVHERTL